MKHLKHLFNQPLVRAHSGVIILVFVVALIGFADAGYLTVEHFRGSIPPCLITENCDVVLTSSYASLFGIPTALFGALYYLAIAIGSFVYLESKHVAKEVKAHHFAILKWALIFTFAGFVMSVWFVYIQAFVLHAFCTYCMSSALTSLILFVTGSLVLRHNLRHYQDPTDII